MELFLREKGSCGGAQADRQRSVRCSTGVQNRSEYGWRIRSGNDWAHCSKGGGLSAETSLICGLGRMGQLGEGVAAGRQGCDSASSNGCLCWVLELYGVKLATKLGGKGKDLK